LQGLFVATGTPSPVGQGGGAGTPWKALFVAMVVLEERKDRALL
jgi:hypothetical protein